MDDLKWPREIWMAERDEHDQGVVSAVLSEHATVARWEGDKERDREFHHYIDADIFESAERYFKVQIEALQARVAELEDKAKSDAMDYLADTGQLLDRLETARRDALEEAAKVADKRGFPTCADAIRALAKKG